MIINPQAEELNNTIKQDNPQVLDLLSDKGKAIFFPKGGILSQAAAAKGKRINATIGIAVEDDASPMRLKSIYEKIDVDPKDAFPYAPSYGKPELREVWQGMIREKNPTLGDKQISLPVVSNALTHGLSICGYMFLNPGESIIMPDLFWGNYKLIFINGYGAKIDIFNTFEGKGYDIKAMKEKLLEEGEKKVLLLNFPNNPTGYTPTEEEAKDIISTLKEVAEAGKKITIITDDAYFGLVYEDGIYQESLFGELADLHENILAVKLDGATKEDYVWGFRVGFITYATKGGTKELYSALEAKTAGAIRGNISNASHLSQSLVLKGFTSPTYKDEKKEKYDLLKSRCNKLAKVLDGHEEYDKCFEALPFNSGYFMCIRLKEGLDGNLIRKTLLEEYDTGVISMGNVLRIAFSSVNENLIEELFDNIYKACKGFE